MKGKGGEEFPGWQLIGVIDVREEERMNKTVTIPELMEFINKKMRPVKVVISLLTTRINHSKGGVVELPKEELDNIIAVVQQFIEDFECISIKQPLGSKDSKVIQLSAESERDNFQVTS